MTIIDIMTGPFGAIPDKVKQLVDEQRADEREACAQAAQDELDEWRGIADPFDIPEKMIAAIRARGQLNG